MPQELDPVLHQTSRLAIMSILLSVQSADFLFLKEELKMTAGNLSFQLGKLAEADYIKITKSVSKNYPLTTVSITRKGKTAFEAYVGNIRKYLKL